MPIGRDWRLAASYGLLQHMTRYELICAWYSDGHDSCGGDNERAL